MTNITGKIYQFEKSLKDLKKSNKIVIHNNESDMKSNKMKDLISDISSITKDINSKESYN